MSTATPVLDHPSAERRALPEARVKPRRRLLRRLIVPVLAVVLIVGGVVGFNVWNQAQLYVSTDNAQIQGDPIQVGSMNAGRVDAVNVKVGDHVEQGTVLARVALPSTVGVAQNGQPLIALVAFCLSIVLPRRGVSADPGAAMGH
jgi:hypothetical protein